MDQKKFDKMIEKAKQESKKDFLRFVKGVYNVDESTFEHIWNVPVIPPYKGDDLVTTSLSTKTEDELLDIIDKCIANELGDSDGCFISLSKMESEFTDEELEEWKRKLDNGEININYNAIIVYNEVELKKEYIELVKERPTESEKIDKIFQDYVKEVITHERCHLNMNCFVTEQRDSEPMSEEINGAEITSWEQDDLVVGKNKTRVDYTDYSERNEVLVDTLSQMMSNYIEGDTIENCLYRVIKNRNGKSRYGEDIENDGEVLTMYALFPETLTHWAVFGAYADVRENKLQKKIFEVCGTDAPLRPSKLKEKVEEYVSSFEDGNLSDKQIDMLRMLGYTVYKQIDKEEIKKVATSESAMGAFSNSLLDIKSFINNLQKTDNTNETR